MQQFTFIIATLDSGTTLPRCLASVVRQRKVSVEIIVVDGGSQDNTIAIAQRFGAKIIHCRQPGIYAAFNRGVEAATGEWITFLGADDRLIGDASLEMVASSLPKHSETLNYFESVMCMPGNKLKRIGLAWPVVRKKFRQQQCVPHGSSFYPRSIAKEFLFDEAFQIAGDYDQLAKLFQRHTPVFHNFPTTLVASGGVSTNWGCFLGSLRESEKVRQAYFFSNGKLYIWFLITGFIWRLKNSAYHWLRPQGRTGSIR